MTSQVTFYLSRILNRKVYNPNGTIFGRLKDVIVDVDYPRPKIISLLVKSNRKLKTLDFNGFEIRKIEGQYYFTCFTATEIDLTNLPQALPLNDQILDQQIVDINGRKLVRVNDVRMVVIPQGAYAIAVDVGVEGLLRRLGIAKPLKKLFLLFGVSIPAKFITWDEVETVGQTTSGIQLSKPYSKLHTLHPSDIADIIEDLDKQTQTSIISAMDEEKAADVLEELGPETQVHILESISKEKAADLLEKMPADEAAEVLEELDTSKAEELLNEMELESSEEVRELLEYPDNTVGGLMSTEYFVVGATMKIKDVIEELRHQKPEQEATYNLFVTDTDEKLMATITLRDLVINDPETLVSEIMNTDVITVLDSDRIDSLAELCSKYNMLSIPVTDEEMKLQGMVVIDDIVEDLLAGGKTK